DTLPGDAAGASVPDLAEYAQVGVLRLQNIHAEEAPAALGALLHVGELELRQVAHLRRVRHAPHQRSVEDTGVAIILVHGPVRLGEPGPVYRAEGFGKRHETQLRTLAPQGGRKHTGERLLVLLLPGHRGRRQEREASVAQIALPEMQRLMLRRGVDLEGRGARRQHQRRRRDHHARAWARHSPAFSPNSGSPIRARTYNLRIDGELGNCNALL